MEIRTNPDNLPLTGSKAEMISRLKAAIQLHPAQPPSSGRVQKRTVRSKKATVTRSRRADSTNANRVLDDASDKSLSVGSVDGFEEDNIDLALFGLSAPQSIPTDSQSGLFMDAQMAAIQDTVRLSLEQAINSRSCSSTEPLSGPPPPITLTPSPSRQGAATPLGLHRPLDRNLEDKILRAPTTAKPTVPVQTPQDCCQETDLSASDSTGPQGVPQVPVRSRTSAAVAGPLPTLSSTAQTASPGTLNVTIRPPAPATAARN